jgi:ArsR family transcriptional regulator, arsenate/arsenite/antimonite-responsive transcriptional repressor
VTTLEVPVLPAAQCCAPLAAPALSEEEAQADARLFKALADPTRVWIVNLLATNAEPVCVCDITYAVGRSQATVSFHLKKLTGAGLLEREQRGVWAYYSVNRQALARLGAAFDPEGGSR